MRSSIFDFLNNSTRKENVAEDLEKRRLEETNANLEKQVFDLKDAKARLLIVVKNLRTDETKNSLEIEELKEIIENGDEEKIKEIDDLKLKLVQLESRYKNLLQQSLRA